MRLILHNHHSLRRYYPDQVSGSRRKDFNPQPLSAAKAAPQDIFILALLCQECQEGQLTKNGLHINYMEMKFKTKTSVSILGILCISGLILFIDGISNSNLVFALFGLCTLIWVMPFFVFYLKMVGNIYCANRKIIMERIYARKINSINENLQIKLGIYSVKFTNEDTIYLDKENDKNNVMVNIYNQAQESAQNKTIDIPFLYKRDNGINRVITVDNEKIEIENLWGRKDTVYNGDVNKVEIKHLVNHQLVLYIFCKSRKIIIPLNKKTNMAEIEYLYLLERFFAGVIRAQ